MKYTLVMYEYEDGVKYPYFYKGFSNLLEVSSNLSDALIWDSPEEICKSVNLRKDYMADFQIVKIDGDKIVRTVKLTPELYRLYSSERA
jgi:hypothetical protein